MKRLSTITRFALLAGLGATIVGWSVTGCKSSNGDKPATSAGSTTQPAFAGLFPPAEPKSGAQMWADNCSRCHNIRPPEYYSDAEWEAICMHMRLRADLTGEEQREIAKFLRASN
jgi:hypothetical protein